MDYGSIIKYVVGRFSYCYSNSNYYSYIGTWLDWYKGNIKSFHTIKVSNGLTTPTREIYSLKMAKRVCEDWTSSMLNEDVKIVISSTNKKSSIFVQGSKNNGGVLGSNNFEVLLSDTLEQMFALGTSAFVIDLDNIAVDENGNIVLGDEMLTPDSSRFWPLEGYVAGQGQPSFDKQYVRDWLKANPDSDYLLPEEVVTKTVDKYKEAYELLTGTPFSR